MAIGHVTREKAGNVKPTRYFSDRHEKAVAKAVNGQQQLNSGATPFQKGDIINKHFLIECKTKTSQSDSISIKKAWLEKNQQEALYMGKSYNALAFNFGPDSSNYYIIDESLFKYLLEFLESCSEDNA